MIDLTNCINQELYNYKVASLNHTQAFHSFVTLAQLGDWEAATRSQLHSVAMLEVAMDAYMRACRIQSMMAGQEE